MSTTITPPSLPKTVVLDPVTGAAVLSSHNKPCCHHPTSSTSTLHLPNHSSSTFSSFFTSSSSFFYSLAGLIAAAGLGYGGYRAFQYYKQQQAKELASRREPVLEATFPIVSVTEEKKFDSALADVQRNKAPSTRVFVLVEAAKDPITQISWCPDCNKAEPLIISALNPYSSSVILIRAPVTRESYKNNPTHPYRIHSQLSVQRIPTLYAIDETGRVTRQLIETECHDKENLRRFVTPQ